MQIHKAMRKTLLLPLFLLPCLLYGQAVINEGSNRNYLTIQDENGDSPDWIELYNPGADTFHLLNYSLTDDEDNPARWVFPNVQLLPGEFKTVFCSGKDRKPVSGFKQVVNTGTFVAATGWNTHAFSTPFYWDGVSNLLINTCSYSSAGYTVNSVFNQSYTPFPSTTFSFQDGSPAACWANFGGVVNLRPNMQFNGLTVGTGTVQNSPTDYPAPYGNWYWGARNQMLVLASELTAAGLTAGEITSIAFDVAWTDPNTTYDYIEIHMKLVSKNAVSSEFDAVDPNNYLHTNFKISKSGETIYLFSPTQTQVSSLLVSCESPGNSTGSFPDASSEIALFQTPTPSASNNTSEPFSDYLLAPQIAIEPGFRDAPFTVAINNPNGPNSTVYYTLDGSEPTVNSTPYNGNPVFIYFSCALKARAFADGVLPSPVAAATYFFGVDHYTPILSVVTDKDNLYGANGIFDNWWTDWERAAWVDYFDENKELIFSQHAGIQVDGGWGGSRSHPQRSFRVELDHGVLGDGSIDYPIIPNRPERTKYSEIYLRNGSNQWQVLPYKDASQVEAMSGETNGYYSAMRPVSVYINGAYFGLYELREKINTEFFEVYEGADPDSMDILSVSAWYGGVLRPVVGSVDSFIADYVAWNALDPAAPGYWDEADQYFDMEWYTDYIIAQSWMANVDWPGNNIRLYRSNATGFRWRYCTIDLELGLAPNSWTDCYFDHIQHMLGQDPGNPFINVWLKSLQNDRFRNYFINRFADVMNTAYRHERILGIENDFFNQMVLEMDNEYARWNDPNNIPALMDFFYNNHLTFQFQLSERTEQVRNHIQSNFALPNQVDLTLDVHPAGAGKIKISTVSPDEYPWQGVYFNGLPIKIEAIPAEGYQFSHWGENGLISNVLSPVFTDTLDIFSIAFDAFFEADISAVREQDENEGGYFVFPNPATDYLFLGKSGEERLSGIEYQVFDLNGRMVQGGVYDGGIDVRGLPPAVYLVKVWEKGVVAVVRFVK